MKKYDSSELLLTNYPSGRWVLTGQNGDVITSESGWEKSLDFGRKNDISTVALERAEARGFNWPQSMFEAATEHKNDAGDHLFTQIAVKPRRSGRGYKARFLGFNSPGFEGVKGVGLVVPHTA